jgi:hypothetical protein
MMLGRLGLARVRPAPAVLALALGAGSLAGWAQSPSRTPVDQGTDSGMVPAAQDGSGDAVVEVDFKDPELSPTQWTLTLHRDGSGHFDSRMGTPPDKAIDTPSVNRDVQLSAGFAGHVFAMAQRHNWFNEDCDSHLKVAFQGWKTLSYRGPGGNGSCTFNYSRDKDIQALSDSLGAVAETILEGARLEILLEHDRLGLDKEMEFLVDAAGNGRAQQICTIRDILSRLAEDDEVMERVRKRARMLLAQGNT